MRRNQAQVALLVALFVASGTCADAQQPVPQRLTLKDAIRLALKNNLGVRVSRTQVDESEGTRERLFSALLPHASADTMASLQNRNLSVVGISVPGFPTVVGPFTYYDFRFSAQQELVDRQAYHNWKAGEKQEQAVKLDYQDTRDLVIRQAAGLYLDAEFGSAEVEAAESRVVTSETLERLAMDQHDQGLATAVDVVRAQVQLARDRQNTLVARNTYQTTLLSLARFLGLSPGSPLELAERLQFHGVEAPDVNRVLQTALEARSDYRALLIQREALAEQQKASHARYLPKLSINGDYGPLGRNFGNMPGIGEIQGTLSITLFDRDRKGEEKELESRLERLNAQIDDLARGIEQDLHQAVLDLQSTADQVTVTEAALDLAQRELALARDRFRSGVTDNIEVVTAQSALASAQDDRIGALARHADARIALARALGATEKIYQTYLGEP
jgi:outer membrane protein TolC